MVREAIAGAITHTYTVGLGVLGAAVVAGLTIPNAPLRAAKAADEHAASSLAAA